MQLEDSSDAPQTVSSWRGVHVGALVTVPASSSSLLREMLADWQWRHCSACVNTSSSLKNLGHFLDELKGGVVWRPTSTPKRVSSRAAVRSPICDTNPGNVRNSGGEGRALNSSLLQFSMALVSEVLLLMNIQRMDMFLTPTQHTNQMESKPTEHKELNLWAEMCRTAAETKKIEQTNMTFPLIRKKKVQFSMKADSTYLF